MSGKGWARRPEDRQAIERNWDRIFEPAATIKRIAMPWMEAELERMAAREALTDKIIGLLRLAAPKDKRKKGTYPVSLKGLKPATLKGKWR